MSRILTPSRLTYLSSFPKLANNWYYLAAATLSVCNRPEEIPSLFEYTLQTSPSAEHATIAAKTREALLKGSALAGLPKAINALTQLKSVTPPELRETSVKRPPLHSIEAMELAGAQFFDQVYGKISKRIQGQLNSAYPDLAVYAVHSVYGSLLSFTDVLSPKETSLVVVACLIPQDVNPQLKGHLKGALNNGATSEEVANVRQLSIDVSEWCGVTWREPVAQLKPTNL